VRSLPVQAATADALAVSDGNEEWILQPCGEGQQPLSIGETNEMAAKWLRALQTTFLRVLEGEVEMDDDVNVLQSLWLEVLKTDVGGSGAGYVKVFCVLDKIAGVLLYEDEESASSIPRGTPKRSVAWKSIQFAQHGAGAAHYEGKIVVDLVNNETLNLRAQMTRVAGVIAAIGIYKLGDPTEDEPWGSGPEGFYPTEALSAIEEEDEEEEEGGNEDGNDKGGGDAAPRNVKIDSTAVSAEGGGSSSTEERREKSKNGSRFKSRKKQKGGIVTRMKDKVFRQSQGVG